GTTPRGRRSPGGTASRPCGRWSSTASSTDPPSRLPHPWVVGEGLRAADPDPLEVRVRRVEQDVPLLGDDGGRDAQGGGAATPRPLAPTASEGLGRGGVPPRAWQAGHRHG